MSAQSVAALPRCEECERLWLTTSNVERRHAYWIDDGPEEKLVFYCRVCAKHEFGEEADA
jgi:hypothetical protein